MGDCSRAMGRCNGAMLQGSGAMQWGVAAEQRGDAMGRCCRAVGRCNGAMQQSNGAMLQGGGAMQWGDAAQHSTAVHAVPAGQGSSRWGRQGRAAPPPTAPPQPPHSPPTGTRLGQSPPSPPPHPPPHTHTFCLQPPPGCNECIRDPLGPFSAFHRYRTDIGGCGWTQRGRFGAGTPAVHFRCFRWV